jgi:hypothetical protein
VPGDPISTAWQEPLAQWGDDHRLPAVDAMIAQGDHRGVVDLLRADPTDDPVVHIGLARARVVAGNAWTAVAEMERLYANDPDNPVVARYLAACLLAAADQSRDVTRDGLLVVTNERQLAACESAGYRILDLDIPEDLTAAGQHLVDLATTGRVWTWRDRQLTVVRLVAAMGVGLAAVVVGGAAQSVPLVVFGIVMGAVLAAWLVLRDRRPAWWMKAEKAVVWRHGLADR